MSNLADSGSNDSDSNGEFEQLLPYPSISPPPSTSFERGETNLSNSPTTTRASPPVTPTHSMASKTYLDSEPAATPKCEADSSAEACCCCSCPLTACMKNPHVESILMWNCWVRSLLVLVAGLVLLLTVQNCSMFEVLGYLGFALLIVGGAGRLVRMFLGSPQQQQATPGASGEAVPSSASASCAASGASCPISECKRGLVSCMGCLEQCKWEVSEECAKEVLHRSLPHINQCLAQLKTVFLLTDTIKAVKFGVVCWLLLYIGSWFDLLTLLQIAWVALFSLPKVYTLYKDQIDSALHQAKGVVGKFWEQAKSKVPGAKPKTQ